MSPPVDPITPTEKLPAKADVVIVGGGIIGVSAAYFLAKKGLSVVLCEKGRIGGEQSSRNWGYCRQQGRDPGEIPLIIESLKIWRGLNEEIQDETGFRQAGVAYLAASRQDMERYEEWVGYAQQYQLDTKLLTGADLEKIAPGGAKKWLGALYTASDGRAEPAKAAPAIARAVQRLGGAVMTDCAIRGFETKAGRVSTVFTEAGPVETDALVVAGGAWSRLFLRRHGIDLPQQTVISSVMRTAPIDAGIDTSLSAPNFAIRKRLDGGYTIAHGGASYYHLTPDSFRLMKSFWAAFQMERKSLRIRFGSRFFEAMNQDRKWRMDEVTPFEEKRIWDPEPSEDILGEAKRNLTAAFPAFADAKIEQGWAGAIDVTPDAVPAISAVEDRPGLFVATGFSGHGFGIGPGAGRLMADLVSGAQPIVDPDPFRFSRFHDGTKIAPFTET